MQTRTTTEKVQFRNPFTLDGFEEVLPAGFYTVYYDEELIQGLSFTAYVKTHTTLVLPAMRGNPLLTRSITIDHANLQAALSRDQELSNQA